MSQARKLMLGLVALISLCGIASADWLPLTPMTPVSDLNGQPLIVGDKEFSDFELFELSTDGGAILPNANSLFVQGGRDDVTGDYGLKFSMSWNAGTGQTVNANLSFKVAILPQYPEWFIEDVSLVLINASATGSGVVNASEIVLAEAISPTPTVLASLSCSKQDSDGGANIADYAVFAPVKEIYVYKDISITGGSYENGAAHLSGFYQYFSQIPEPASICLIALVAPLLLRRWRR
jgi:hypothetical protein